MLKNYILRLFTPITFPKTLIFAITFGRPKGKARIGVLQKSTGCNSGITQLLFESSCFFADFLSGTHVKDRHNNIFYPKTMKNHMMQKHSPNRGDGVSNRYLLPCKVFQIRTLYNKTPYCTSSVS